MSGSPDGDRLGAELIRIGLVVVLGLSMFVLDQTIVTVGLETLGGELDADVATVQWVATAYLLASAIVVPASGWAIDRFGAKRLFGIAVALFTVCSALCAAAWDIHSLIAFRFLQGALGALLLPVGQTILARSAGPHRMGRMMSLFGVAIIIGPVLGPIVGGLIVENASWRWLFLVNLPVGAVSLLLILRMLPADSPPAAGQRLDRAGLALAGPGLALVVYGISRAGQLGTFGDAETWVAFAAGAALTAAFVVHARRRGERALIPLDVFRDRGFSGTSVVVVTISMILFGTLLLLPLYFQQVRGESAVDTGLLLAVEGIGTALALPIAGRLSDRIGPRPIVPVGILLAAVGTLPFTQASETPSYWLLGAGVAVLGAGTAATITVAMAAGYQNLPASAAAHTSAALLIFQRVGATIGTALLSVVLATNADAATPLADAYAAAFWWAVALAVAGVPFVLLLPSRAERAALPDAAP